jgi:hypothetical protein
VVKPREAKAREVPGVDRQVELLAHGPDDDLLVRVAMHGRREALIVLIR